MTTSVAPVPAAMANQRLVYLVDASLPRDRVRSLPIVAAEHNNFFDTGLVQRFNRWAERAGESSRPR
jgi:hypothetical protein